MQRAASLVVVRFDEDCCVFPWLRANNVAEQLRASTSGAKAQAFSGLYGTAEAVPFQTCRRLSNLLSWTAEGVCPRMNLAHQRQPAV